MKLSNKDYIQYSLVNIIVENTKKNAEWLSTDNDTRYKNGIPFLYRDLKIILVEWNRACKKQEYSLSEKDTIEDKFKQISQMNEFIDEMKKLPLFFLEILYEFVKEGGIGVYDKDELPNENKKYKIFKAYASMYVLNQNSPHSISSFNSLVSQLSLIETKTSSSTTLYSGLFENIPLLSVPVVLKVSYYPKEITENSNQVESQIYNTDINRLINDNNTPFLVQSYGTIKCNNCTEYVPRSNTSETKGENKERIEKSFDTKQQNILILERTQGRTLFDVLPRMDDKGIVSVIFQVLWTLCCFHHLKLKHNDLHLANIFVETFTSPIKFNFEYNNLKFSLITKYMVKIYDFDRGSVYGNPEVNRNLDLDVNFCDHLGVCNYENVRFDMFSFLSQMNLFLPKINPFTNIPDLIIRRLLNFDSEYAIRQKRDWEYPHLMRYRKKTRTNGKSYWDFNDMNEAIKKPKETMNIFMNIVMNDDFEYNPFSLNENNTDRIVFSLPAKRELVMWYPKPNDIKDPHDLSKYNFNDFLNNPVGITDFLSEVFQHETLVLYKDNDISWFLLIETVEKEYRNKTKENYPREYIPQETGMTIACTLLSCSIYYQIVNRQYLTDIDSQTFSEEIIKLFVNQRFKSYKNYINMCINNVSHVLQTIPVKIPII